jgi:hypothetical protein
MKTILTLSFAVTVLGSMAFAGPGGREPDRRIAPREHSVMTVARDVGTAYTGVTIGLAVTGPEIRSELKLERRFNAQGQPFYLYTPRWMDSVE